MLRISRLMCGISFGVCRTTGWLCWAHWFTLGTLTGSQPTLGGWFSVQSPHTLRPLQLVLPWRLSTIFKVGPSKNAWVQHPSNNGLMKLGGWWLCTELAPCSGQQIWSQVTTVTCLALFGCAYLSGACLCMLLLCPWLSGPHSVTEHKQMSSSPGREVQRTLE